MILLFQYVVILLLYACATLLTLLMAVVVVYALVNLFLYLFAAVLYMIGARSMAVAIGTWQIRKGV